MRISILSFLTIITLLFSCKTNQELNTMEGTQEMSTEKARSIFTNKVTVTAKEGAKPKSFEKRYQKYILKYRGMSSKSQNMMAFTFDDEKITSPQLIELLKKDNEVITANPLRKANTRATISKSGDKRNGTLTK